ncbi:MAG: aminopeptidase P family protein [Planctomycetales bacterium]|nr:aminopeptidase P family protein [Planctomycetales bacterium]
MAEPAAVDLTCCQIRRQRLLDVMQAEGWTRVILTSYQAVQWISGARFATPFRPICSLEASGELVLVAPHKVPDSHAADTAVAYPAKWLSTMRSEQTAAAVEQWLATTGNSVCAGKIAIEFGDAPMELTRRLGNVELHDVDPAMFALRRRKEADELRLLRTAIAGTEKMYRVARELIRPGLTEIELFNHLQTAAVEVFDEPLTGTGNDYRCNARGGMPRGDGHAAQAGELWILDLGPAYRGYFADNARTIAVTEPTEDQLTAWTQIMQVFAHVEATARPGKSCRELFDEVQAMLDQSPVGVFNHHLGHGIGLHPHEAPHLNPHWDDTFEVGDVFTAEPGLYDADRLRHGMRLENDYLITKTGVELLTPFPLELK